METSSVEDKKINQIRIQDLLKIRLKIGVVKDGNGVGPESKSLITFKGNEAFLASNRKTCIKY
jgi:hypothetical protein